MKLARALLLASLAGACSSTILVQVPPRVVLDHEQTIGIVTFDAQGGAIGTRDVASRFVEAILQGQPGVPVLELGSAASVLSAVGSTELDSDAARLIGQRFGVHALIVGSLSMKESEPRIDVDVDQGFDLASLHAQVRLDGRLEAKLVETERGATLWRGSSTRWIQLARVSGSSGGFGSIDLPDRERQIERLVHDMVEEASCDFRPTWERQPAPEQ